MDTITGFRRESITSASGGNVLSLIGGPSTTEAGNASFSFRGETGLYDAIIATYDENDGAAKFNITKNGNPIGSTSLNQNLGFSGPIPETKVSITIAAGIEVKNGDLIGIEGFENGYEYARLDFIDLIRVSNI
jgi:hypothetical protein